jgi:hypothetical protein
MSCQSKAQHSLDRLKVLPAMLGVLAATVANAGAPSGLPPAQAQLPAPHTMDLSAPRLGPVRERAGPLRFDHLHGSSATANGATRQFTQSFDDELRAKSAFVIRWQTKPELERVARNLRHNGLPVVKLWHSGRGLVALGLSPRGVPGLYFTQKTQD